MPAEIDEGALRAAEDAYLQPVKGGGFAPSMRHAILAYEAAKAGDRDGAVAGRGGTWEEAVSNALASDKPVPRMFAAKDGGARPGHVEIAHDGFAGDIIGSYVTREGKRGVVVQQDGTRVVHVYGEKWIEGQITTPPAPA